MDSSADLKKKNMFLFALARSGRRCSTQCFLLSNKITRQRLFRPHQSESQTQQEALADSKRRLWHLWPSDQGRLDDFLIATGHLSICTSWGLNATITACTNNIQWEAAVALLDKALVCSEAVKYQTRMYKKYQESNAPSVQATIQNHLSRFQWSPQAVT